MFIQSIVYVILTVLSATAAIAASMPIGKGPGGQAGPEFDDQPGDTRQQ